MGICKRLSFACSIYRNNHMMKILYTYDSDVRQDNLILDFQMSNDKLFVEQHGNMMCHLKNFFKKRVCLCETRMPPAATKSKLAIFSIKVTVKVTRSLTLVSFERVSLVEYDCII